MTMDLVVGGLGAPSPRLAEYPLFLLGEGHVIVSPPWRTPPTRASRWTLACNGCQL
ncbi:hypothetical protein ACNQVK_24710 [Mycobacterium sp. 134]